MQKELLEEAKQLQKKSSSKKKSERRMSENKIRNSIDSLESNIRERSVDGSLAEDPDDGEIQFTRFKVEADDSICSNQSQRQVIDENQLANLFKNAIKGKRKTKKKKSPSEPLRQSNRVRKSVEKLQVSAKGQSYD